MKHKRVVISGGPSSGKTTIINKLKKEGHFCFQEISRELIQKAQSQGIDQPFLSNPKQFNNDLLEARLDQFHKALDLSGNCFYDRGVHDVIGYMYYGKQPVPQLFKDACDKSKYDIIFLLPPWKEIHVMDYERYETFEQATEIYNCLHAVYTEYGYNIIEVPTGSIIERKEFILRNLLIVNE